MIEVDREELARRIEFSSRFPPRDASDKFVLVHTDAEAAVIVAALRSPPASVVLGEEVKRLKTRIDSQLNNYLCEMQPNYDDSITGFNEAWDIVREIFTEERAHLAQAPVGSDK